MCADVFTSHGRRSKPTGENTALLSTRTSFDIFVQAEDCAGSRYYMREYELVCMYFEYHLTNARKRSRKSHACVRSVCAHKTHVPVLS